jgi:hypothetical protein
MDDRRDTGPECGIAGEPGNCPSLRPDLHDRAGGSVPGGPGEAHPAGLPLDKGVRFTENTATVHVGDGLWVGASEAPTTFKIYAIDPATD